MTNPHSARRRTTGAIGVGVLTFVVLCCGGAVAMNAFSGGEDPGPSAPTEEARQFAGAPTTTAPAPATSSPTSAPTSSPASSQGTPKPRSTSAKPSTSRPKPKKTSKKPKPSPTRDDEVYYKNCTAVRAAGAAPIHRGDPGYARHLDRDGDGVGCETD